MKHAILGPRKGVIEILDEENSRTTPISDELAEFAAELKNNKQMPYFINGEITSYQIELAKGNSMEWNESSGSWDIVPLPPPPIEIPSAISAWQARAALKLTPLENGNLFDVVEQAIYSLPDGPQKIVIQTAWENNASFERNSPTILAIASSLNLTEEQIDSLFILGGSLSV
jgi:hypothetical protein